MKKNRFNNYLLVIPSLFLLGCSQKINTNFDLSNLPKPKIVNSSQIESKQPKNIVNKSYISDLVPLKSKEQILSKFKYGKQDPFSESDIQLNNIYSDLKITGFLNAQSKKYVFVNYLGNEGAVSEKSIGGVNSNLLPEGAKVINIDNKNFELTINYKNENFVFEL
tara:strand:- start:978 stop:1472 length:495 start_codon:yes stop_codon:yes gene_type:complete